MTNHPIDPSEQQFAVGRYLRQERFAPIGQAGQQKLQKSSVLVCGCGALGSMIAERLVRSGVGRLRLVDRDWVELSNLQRQTLFTEQHAQAAAPKAVAAAELLRQINSSTNIDSFVEDVTCDNIRMLADGCDLIMDGTDNFETRFLINDYSIRFGVPWIHGGCLGASGQVQTILPGKTACFRCLVPDMPPADSMQSCDLGGVLGPAVGIIACWQSAEALKILTGNSSAVSSQLIVVDTWETDCRRLNVRKAENCPTCGQNSFPFLDGAVRSESVVLCGKNAVQIMQPESSTGYHDLNRLAERLAPLGEVRVNAFFVRLKLPDHQITLFRGGRTVVEGTTSPAEARSILARTLGI